MLTLDLKKLRCDDCVVFDVYFVLLPSAVVSHCQRVLYLCCILVVVEELVLGYFEEGVSVIFTSGKHHTSEGTAGVGNGVIAIFLNQQAIWVVKLAQMAILHDKDAI